jgi:hypothetical protein
MKNLKNVSKKMHTSSSESTEKLRSGLFVAAFLDTLGSSTSARALPKNWTF